MAIDPELGIYAGWVAHEGSFAARQSSPRVGSPSSTLLFCGECFDTNASSGVSLSALYATQGDRFVAELNGLFTGLLINRARRQALLFNDRYGSERLYSYDKNGVTYFASEAKALLAVLPELRDSTTRPAQFLAFARRWAATPLSRLKLFRVGSLWRFTPVLQLAAKRDFDLQSGKRCPRCPLAASRRLRRHFDQCCRLLRSTRPWLSLTVDWTLAYAACMPRSVSPPVSYHLAAGGHDTLLDLRIARQ